MPTPDLVAGLRPLIAPFVFLFGLVIGSFLNVVIHRLPRGESLVRPRSRCPGCGRMIAWYDNIPVASWLWLRGRCRGCGAPIPVRYPLIELASGALALAFLAAWGPTPAAAVFYAFAAALLAIAFIDIPTQTIPLPLSLGSLALGLLFAPFNPLTGGFTGGLVGALAGGGLLLSVSIGYWLLTRREGMGLGDAQLLAAIGAFTGALALPFVLLASALQGLLAALVLLLAGRLKPPLHEMEAEAAGELAPRQRRLGQMAVPFGPFLALAALEYLLFHRQVEAVLAAAFGYGLR